MMVIMSGTYRIDTQVLREQPNELRYGFCAVVDSMQQD